MNIESVPVEHDARTWALEGITQHSLDVVGVAGDHLNVAPLQYLATHAATREVHGYFEGKYFWGVLWARHLYANNKHALAALLYRVSQDIQAMSVRRIIIVTESRALCAYLKELGLSPVYAPSSCAHRLSTDLDSRYVFELSCEDFLWGDLSGHAYHVTFGAAHHLELAHTKQASSTQRYGWIAKNDEGAPVGYIELGTHKHQAHLRLLYTDPAYRGQGIAGLLVGKATQHAMLQKCTLFTVETLSYQASTFYEKQGFRKILTLEGLRPMCVSTPCAISKISDPLSFIFLARLLS